MKKIVCYILLFISILCAVSPVLAQPNKVQNELDSLLTATSRNTQTDSVQTLAFLRISDIYTFFVFDYKLGVQYAIEACQYAQKANNKVLESTALRKLGNIYYLRYIYDKAVEYYLAALKVAEESGSKQIVAHSLNNLGNVYARMAEVSNPKKNYSKALEYHLRALEIRKNDPENRVHSLLNINNAYRGLKQYPQAIRYLEEAYAEYVARKDNNGIDLTQTSLGEIYLEWAKETSKTEYLNTAEKYFKERALGERHSSRTSSVLVYMGEIRFLQKQWEEAIHFYQKGIELAKATNQLETIKRGSFQISSTYKETGQYKEALEYYKLYRTYKDSLLSEKSNNQITELNTKYETKKKEKDIELLTKDNKLQQADMSKQQLIINVFIGILVLVIIVALILYNLFIIKKRLNIKLDNTNKLLLQKNELIEKQKENIVNSIDYAKTMQQVIIVQENDIQKIFPDSLIFYKPKDIVSGDFYWSHKTDDGKAIVAVIDCTGHGVPGAFMSIIANTLLNQIIRQTNITTPSEILSQLNYAVYNALHQNKERSLSDDGLDIALCCIDYKNKTLEYAGAQHPLYILTNGELKIVKADIYTIGGGNFPSKKGDPKSIKYTNHTLTLEAGMRLFLFTDGYIDQFGGPEKRKFGSGNLQRLLLDNKDKSISELNQIVSKTHKEWKGTVAQTDDILFIGITIDL